MIYQGLIHTIDDEEAVSEMLSNFPVRHDDELVTENFLHRELTGLELRIRTEMIESQTAMEIRIVDRIDARMDAKIDASEQRLGARIDGLDAKIDGVEQRLDARIDGLEQRLDAKIDSLDAKFDAKFTKVMSYGIGGNIATVVAIATVILLAVRM